MIVIGSDDDLSMAERSWRNQARPDANMTVRTALDRAAAAVGGKFGNAPLVEAAIRQTIADAYRGLGIYPKAEEQQRRVLALRLGALGESDDSALRAAYALATLISEQGKYREAEPLFAGLLAQPPAWRDD
jgi:hypothetical protein